MYNIIYFSLTKEKTVDFLFVNSLQEVLRDFFFWTICPLKEEKEIDKMIIEMRQM